MDIPEGGIPLHRILSRATICILSLYQHTHSLHISDHAHNPSSYPKPATPPQQLIEDIQWYVENGPAEEDELNGADERLLNRLIAELNTNPPDGETITLEVTDLAEDHAYCNHNHISCTHCIPYMHTHQTITACMCPSM